MRLATLSFVSVVTLAMGCGGTPSSITGTLSISSPASNASVPLPGDNKVPVTFSTNYILKNPGTCNNQSGCGSVYLLIDGTACNAPNESWNTNATSSPSSVDLTLCSMAVGTHTISAELHQDTGAFVEDEFTKQPVTSAVTIMVVATP